MFDTIKKDIQAIKDRDPLCSPHYRMLLPIGTTCITTTQNCSFFYRYNLKLLARILSTINRFLQVKFIPEQK